jgi:hypothetical protein
MPPRKLQRAPLAQLDLEPDVSRAVPARVTTFLADAGTRIDAFFELWRRSRNLTFFPSDYELVYGVLQALRESNPEATRLCEWGSGFGVIAGLGAMLGFESSGIEIDARCVAASRSLLEDHKLQVSILEGSFVPQQYIEDEELSDGDTRTALWGAGAIDEVDVEIADFDVVFAFPWPDEEEMYFDLFRRYAAVGAILITYSALEGVRVQRKVG